MYWIIQDPCFGEETRKLAKALENKKIRYDLVKNRPDSIEGVPDIVRGSVEFLEDMDRFIYDDGYYHLDAYSCSSYYKYFGSRLLNHDCIFMPWGLLKFNKELIFKSFPNSDKLFIRPNSGKKLFTGTTLTKKWWDKELDIIGGLPYTIVKDEDMVLISSAKEIEKEYRLLMYNNELIDYSIYEGNYLPVDINFINFFAKSIDYFPDWIYTMDLAWTKDSVKIVELNSFYSSGLYDMDYDKVVSKIERIWSL